MLNWGLCRGYCVIPKSIGLNHLQENMNVFDFKLENDEIEKICKLDTGDKLFKWEFPEGFNLFV